MIRRGILGIGSMPSLSPKLNATVGLMKALGPLSYFHYWKVGLDLNKVSLPLPLDTVRNPIAVSRPLGVAKGEFFGTGSILTRRLLAKDVLGRCGLGLADGVSTAEISGGELGAESRRMLSFFDSVDGGVMLLTFTQSFEFTGEDHEVWRTPMELWAPDARRGR